MDFGPRAVEALSCSAIRSGCCFCGIKRAKIMSMPIKFYASNKNASLFIKTNALIASSIVFLRSAISVILRRRGVTEIFPAVVRLIFIFVINLVFWPLAFNIQPRQTVRHIFVAVYSYFYPTLFFFWGSGYRSCGATFRKRHFPNKKSRSAAIADDRAQICSGNIDMRVFSTAFHALLIIPEGVIVNRGAACL